MHEIGNTANYTVGEVKVLILWPKQQKQCSVLGSENRVIHELTQSRPKPVQPAHLTTGLKISTLKHIAKKLYTALSVRMLGWGRQAIPSRIYWPALGLVNDWAIKLYLDTAHGPKRRAHIQNNAGWSKVGLGLAKPISTPYMKV